MAADDHGANPPPVEDVLNEEEEVGELLGTSEYPIRLGALLQISKEITPEARREFIRKSQELFAKRNKTNYEKNWLSDYVAHQEGLLQAPMTTGAQQGSSGHSSRDEFCSHFETGNETEAANGRAIRNTSTPHAAAGHQFQPPQFQPPQFQSPSNFPMPTFGQEIVRPADLNKLFVKPETFDGIQPPPRQWLDQYEKAAFSNGWSDTAKIKYMSTFLKETAYSWLTEIVPLHYPNGFDWAALRQLFVRCYMGESDRQAAKREFERTIQRENEKAAQFIPRMVQMIKTLDPARPQDVITDDIRQKLLPEYQEKLIMFELRTLQHLYDACTKIEAGLAASRAATRQRLARARDRDRFRTERRDSKSPKREEADASVTPKSPRREDSASATPRSSREPSPDSKKGDKPCFRCDRAGHWSRECHAKTKLDGSPCVDKPAAKKNVKFSKSVHAVTDGSSSQDESSEDESAEDDLIEAKPRLVGAIRDAGRNYICTVVEPSEKATQNLVRGGTLIKHQVNCANFVCDALIDTGAYVSTIDADIAAQQNWKPKASGIKLFHAVGEEMQCLGRMNLQISITVNGTTRSVMHCFMVVKNLCARIILGIGFIRDVNLVIKAADKRPLSFGKQFKRKGVRAKEVILPPRSVNLIVASVDTSAQVVMTTPFGFDNSIHVANTLCTVNNGTIVVPIANMDLHPVKLREGIQIAGIQPLSLVDVEPTETVNATLVIDDSGEEAETVEYGENLTPNEVASLQQVLLENKNAFSTLR